MTSPRWDALGRVSPSRLAEARLGLHHAAQLPAAVGRRLVAPRPDDGHTSLAWDDGLGALLGPEVAAERGWRAGLVPRDLALVIVVGREVARRLDLDGETTATARAWLAEAASERGTAGGRLSFDAPYAMPTHALEAGGRFVLPADGTAAEVERWLANADRLLREIAAAWPGAAPVRTWPHHFDVGSVLPLAEETAEDSPSIGIGLSPGDEGIAEPYFYVTAWPPPPTDEALPPLAGPGRWHREGWTGAVLAAGDVLTAGDGPAQAERSAAFLRGAVAALRERHRDRTQRNWEKTKG